MNECLLHNLGKRHFESRANDTVHKSYLAMPEQGGGKPLSVNPLTNNTFGIKNKLISTIMSLSVPLALLISQCKLLRFMNILFLYEMYLKLFVN